MDNINHDLEIEKRVHPENFDKQEKGDMESIIPDIFEEEDWNGDEEAINQE